MNTIKSEAVKQFEENIVKTIKLIIYEKGYAYVIDVARELEINQNTMYSAIKRMVRKGYVEPLGPKGGKNERHSLRLTEEGDELAQKILDRHELLENWLIRLGLPGEQASKEACSMEHGLTDTGFELLRAHVEMASKYMGQNIRAAEIMSKLGRGGTKDESESETITSRMQKMIEQLGGMEGAERKRRLVARAGGEDCLERLLDAAEVGGDIDKIIDVINNARTLLDIYGDKEDYDNLVCFINELGGLKSLASDRKKIASLLALENRYGTVEEMEESLMKLEDAGGIKILGVLKEASKGFDSPEAMLEAFKESMKPLIKALSK